MVKNPKAVIQIVHGSAEHAKRYENFIKFLNKEKYSVYAMDLRGHGETAKGKIFGFFEKQDGANIVLKDVHDVNDIIRKENKNKKIILFGHSMGSFIARAYAAKYDDVDMLIPCGTNHPPKALVSLLKFVSKKKSKKHADKEGTFLSSLSYKAYDKKFKGQGELAWLSKDEENRKAYSKDKLSGFVMTNNGFHVMALWMKDFINKKLIKKQKKIPVLLINGSNDPVGNMGKDVKKAYKFYKKHRFDVKHVEYPGLRHEILNEKENKQVYKDIVTWIEKRKI